MVSFAKARGLSSNSSSLTSSSLSLMSFEMVELLKAPYIDGVCFPTPFVISHSGEEKEGNTTISFNPLPLNEGFSEEKEAHH